MKGIEYLRGIYLAAGLSIKPKTRLSKIDALKEIIRTWGLNPEEILPRDAPVIDKQPIRKPPLYGSRCSKISMKTALKKVQIRT